MQAQRTADVTMRLLSQQLKETEIGTACSFRPVAIDLNLIVYDIRFAHIMRNAVTDIGGQLHQGFAVSISIERLVGDENHRDNLGAVARENIFLKSLDGPHRNSYTIFNGHIKEPNEKSSALQLVEILTLGFPYCALRLPIIEVHVMTVLRSASHQHEREYCDYE